MFRAVVLAACVGLIEATASLCDSDSTYKLVWSEEFNSPTLNKDIWVIPTGVGTSFGKYTIATMHTLLKRIITFLFRIIPVPINPYIYVCIRT